MIQEGKFNYLQTVHYYFIAQTVYRHTNKRTFMPLFHTHLKFIYFYRRKFIDKKGNKDEKI